MVKRVHRDDDDGVETPPPSRGGRGIPADNTAAGLDLASCGRTPDPTYGSPWARLSPKHIIRRLSSGGR